MGVSEDIPSKRGAGERWLTSGALGANLLTLRRGDPLATTYPPRALRSGDKADETTGGGPRFVARLRLATTALKAAPVAAIVALVVHGRSPIAVATTTDPQIAVTRAMALEGLHAEPDDVVWIDTPSGLLGTLKGSTRAVVRASSSDEANHDVYLVRARRSPEGRVVSVESIHQLTKTTDVDETRPIALGEWIAFATWQPATSVYTGVELYDLSGEDQRLIAEWKKFQKVQNAITNLQQTGSIKGVRRRRYALDPTPATVSMVWNGSLLDVDAGGHAIVIDHDVDELVDGKLYARFEHVVKGKPGDFITWTVDRVRAIPWIGPHTIEFLEYNAFKMRDYLKRHFSDWFGEDVAQEVKENSGSVPVKPAYTDPEIGWPPAPLKPVLPSPLPDEGAWQSLEDDPFVGKNPGMPTAFVRTFIRTDPQRVYSTVYITLWDPRQVSLHMVAGTVEPVSATGEVGTGQIPRTPEVLKNVVAGFNGGFQALHFEGGMQVSGALYLPPKPYAATAAELVDGTTAIGTWPGNLPDVPDEILSFRQNLTPLVRDGVINPYHQIKWGGTPPGATDAIHTTRSGICITEEGFVGYFFGFEMSQDSLGRGMVAARCKTGMHLDMNAGHTGFEFYRIAPTGELPDLGRVLEGTWEAEGSVPQLEGWSFRARRMIKSMPHMLFPRYIGRDGRDFMYLTLRNVLPGAPIVARVSPAEEREGMWKVQGIPQHGFPYAVTFTSIRPDAKNPSLHARVLKIDPRTVKLPAVATEGDEQAQTIITFGGATKPSAGGLSLWLAAGSFALGTTSPGPSAVALFGGDDPKSGATTTTKTMLGVTDDDGTLVVVFADQEGSAASLSALLQQLGCSQQMVAPPELEPRFGGSLGWDMELDTKKLATPAVTLIRAEAPGARALFPETPVVAPEVWMPLQAKRVRYFGKKGPKPGQIPPPPPPAPSNAPPPKL